MASQNLIMADEFEKEIARAADRVSDFGPLLHEFADIVREEVKLNFQREEDSDGNPWPAHAPSTEARMGPHPLLRWTGELERAATQAGVNHIEQVVDNELTYGVTGIEYAATHQYGDKSRNIPQREYLGISDHALDQMEERAKDYTIDRILEGF